MKKTFKWAIYRSDPVTQQYGVYEHEGFTDGDGALIDQIQKICYAIDDIPEQDTVQVLFRELTEDQYWFAAVVGAKSGGRNTKMVFNLVADGNFVDNLFNSDLKLFASAFLNLHDAVEKRNVEEFLSSLNKFLKPKKSSTAVSDAAVDLLLEAAAVTGDDTQIFVGTDFDPLDCLNAVFERVPMRLRKTFSFNTGVTAARESVGFGLNFCSPTVLRKMFADGFSGGKQCEKVVHFFEKQGIKTLVGTSASRVSKMLKDVETIPFVSLFLPLVDSWQTLFAVANKKHLSALLERIPEITVLTYLANTESNDEWRALYRLVEKNKPSYPKYLVDALAIRFEECDPEAFLADNATVKTVSLSVENSSGHSQKKKRGIEIRSTTLFAIGKVLLIVAVAVSLVASVVGLFTVSPSMTDSTQIVLELDVIVTAAKILLVMFFTSALSLMLGYHLGKRRSKTEIHDA